jgi:hypothetical protein
MPACASVRQWWLHSLDETAVVSAFTLCSGLKATVHACVESLHLVLGQLNSITSSTVLPCS